MRFDLDYDDRHIIHFLTNNNLLTEREAVVYTLVFTRPIGRDKANLSGLLILYRYDELASIDEINLAIESLIEKKFFEEIDQGSSSRIECIDPIKILTARITQEELKSDLERVIQVLREKGQGLQDYLIENIGWANSRYASDTYFRSISGASRSIKLPVFSFATHSRVKEAIQNAVERGVDVKILMYSPELALKTHGIGRDDEVRTNAETWLKMAKALKKTRGNLEIRFVKNLNHSYLAGALLIDDQLFRYDIYYPELQRGHEGFMIQGKPYHGEASNLYHVLNYYFDAAWSSATYPGFIRNLLRNVSGWTTPTLGIFLIIIGMLTLQGDFEMFSASTPDYGLFFISLGLIPALTGLKKIYEQLSRFQIIKRQN